VSILSNVGLEKLVTWEAEDYVGTAVELARDLSRLEELRTGLRERMRGSALMDAKGFVRGVEGAYVGMWGKWCVGRKVV
jgi:predicted O-linked N-acetylglucosamine transferase (SPINDLY family)